MECSCCIGQVREDRRGNFTAARQDMGITPQKPLISPNISNSCSSKSVINNQKIINGNELDPNCVRRIKRAKNEQVHYRRSSLDPQLPDRHNIVSVIEDMSADSRMVGIIRAVARLPFYVFYCTREQMHMWNTFAQQRKKFSEISVASTKGLVKPLPCQDGIKSSEIFLYSMLINFEGSTAPVNQMLSESNDSELIAFWLKRWIRWGARPPVRIISDYSRALQLGVCLALTHKTIEEYTDAWFLWAKDGKDSRANESWPTSTILGVDMAHLIALVSEWRCFHQRKQVVIKNFYVRAVTLMIGAKSVADFGYILLLTSCVALSEYDDNVTGLSLIPTTKDARNQLQHLIDTRCRDIDVADVSKASLAQNDGQKDYPIDPEEPHSNLLMCTHKWVRRIIDKATPNQSVPQENLSPGQDLNPYWFPDFIGHLESIAKQFRVWSQATVPCTIPPATSSYTELYFTELKDLIHDQPERVDNFVGIHILENLLGDTKRNGAAPRDSINLKPTSSSYSSDQSGASEYPPGYPHSPECHRYPSRTHKSRHPPSPSGLSPVFPSTSGPSEDPRGQSRSPRRYRDPSKKNRCSPSSSFYFLPVRLSCSHSRFPSK